MDAHLFSSAGEKKGAFALPASLFEAPVNWGLMHQAVLMQQGNRRTPVAHVKNRGEVQGSTKKLFQQKHTGRARRGSIRSPLLRGGGKAFGPRNDANFSKSMPRKMRHAALRSCLSLQAQKGAIMILEGYPDAIKTKTMSDLLKKLSVEIGRRVLVVAPGKNEGLVKSSRNIPGVKTVYASYLSPEDVLVSRHVIFLKDAITKAEEIFGKKASDKESDGTEKAPKVKKSAPKAAKAKKATSRTKKSSESSESSSSSAS
jgi:large subunit ribosomal protein L4